MKVIGYTVKKVLGEKSKEFKPGGKMDTSIEFTDVRKEEAEFLKDSEALTFSFKFSVNYEEGESKKAPLSGQVLIEGEVVISASKDESKEVIKAWKKKQLPEATKAHLYNFIFRRCTPRAIQLQDEVKLPSPFIKIPQLTKRNE